MQLLKILTHEYFLGIHKIINYRIEQLEIDIEKSICSVNKFLIHDLKGELFGLQAVLVVSEVVQTQIDVLSLSLYKEQTEFNKKDHNPLLQNNRFIIFLACLANNNEQHRCVTELNNQIHGIQGQLRLARLENTPIQRVRLH